MSATAPAPESKAAGVAEAALAEASAWWTTSIIRIEPGKIEVRGYPIEELIGELRFPEMIWLMLRGELPSRAQALLLDAALVGAVDHGPQAPSISISRMAISCGVELNGAMASAINVLDDVHGGAGQQCMELYAAVAREAGDCIPTLAHVNTVLEGYEAQRRFVPGFGHRFHPIDPRAPRLLALVDDACRTGVVSGRWAHIGRLVEQVLHERKGKRIPMNIDGATAVIFAELGFEPALGRGLFILSRAVGILAHAWEQRGQKARIKGPMPPTIPYRYDGPSTRSLMHEQIAAHTADGYAHSPRQTRGRKGT
jgi:citrate synthase